MSSSNSFPCSRVEWCIAQNWTANLRQIIQSDKLAENRKEIDFFFLCVYFLRVLCVKRIFTLRTRRRNAEEEEIDFFFLCVNFLSVLCVKKFITLRSQRRNTEEEEISYFFSACIFFVYFALIDFYDMRTKKFGAFSCSRQKI